MKYYFIGVFLAFVICHSSFSQSLTKEQKDFLDKNARSIYGDSLQHQPDWNALLPKAKDKKVILIGEFNHGSKEVFEVRNSLIKYLHKRTGVKVILFESGIGELISADVNRNSMTGNQMTNGLFGGWRTKEFVELMDYVKSRNISIAGFDVQRSGGSFNHVLHEIALEYKLDTLTTHNLESRYGQLARTLATKKALYDSLEPPTTRLILDYQAVKEKLSGHINKNSPTELKFTVKTIENRMQFLSYMLQFLKDKDWNRRWAARDSAMADNVQWLIENIYKGQPVIIIGHNFHIGRYNENETVMGELLKTKYDKEMYSIGVFAGAGSYLDNFGKEEKMVPPDSARLDIKHIISNLPGWVSYIDIHGTLAAGGDWIDREITINDTFIDLKNTNRMILSKAFDGVILLKTVSPPKVN